ncbi:MAG: peptidyl-prolyl cis-trans isomerase [Lachnospiraceae bacterium]|nr:peptidyl-prolyl cis-trans isomerase [Lachnospiraceae bacterium]
MSKRTSDLGYDPETDVLCMDKNTVSFRELSVISYLLWDALTAQYNDVYTNPAKVFSPAFSDSEMTLDTYIKEYGLYKELMMLTAFSVRFDSENTLSIAEENEVEAEALAFYNAKIKPAISVENTSETATATAPVTASESAEDTRRLSVILPGDITEEDCKHVFTMYKKARKQQAALRKAANLVISDEEVRVVDCGIVKSSSESAIRKFEADLKKGNDFFMLADSSGINELEHTQYAVTRSEEFPEVIMDTIMELEDGNVSSVISCDGAYYIVIVLDKFDEALSAKNRERMLEIMVNDYYEKECATYIDRAKVYFNREGWEAFELFR